MFGAIICIHIISENCLIFPLEKKMIILTFTPIRWTFVCCIQLASKKYRYIADIITPNLNAICLESHTHTSKVLAFPIEKINCHMNDPKNVLQNKKKQTNLKNDCEIHSTSNTGTKIFTVHDIFRWGFSLFIANNKYDLDSFHRKI